MHALIFVKLHEKFSVNDTWKRLGKRTSRNIKCETQDQPDAIPSRKNFSLILGIKSGACTCLTSALLWIFILTLYLLTSNFIILIILIIIISIRGLLSGLRYPWSYFHTSGRLWIYTPFLWLLIGVDGHIDLFTRLYKYVCMYVYLVFKNFIYVYNIFWSCYLPFFPRSSLTYPLLTLCPLSLKETQIQLALSMRARSWSHLQKGHIQSFSVAIPLGKMTLFSTNSCQLPTTPQLDLGQSSLDPCWDF